MVKVWTSDAVPSGLVRKTEDRITPTTRTHRGERIVQETYLESFEGQGRDQAPRSLRQGNNSLRPAPRRAGPSRPVSLHPRRPTGRGPAPAPHSRPAATQPAVQRPAPRARRPAPVLTPQQEVMQRYTAVTTRLVQARAALARTQRIRGAQDDNLPADIRDARDRAIAKRKAAEAALSENNLDEAEKELKAMDEAVTVVEDM